MSTTDTGEGHYVELLETKFMDIIRLLLVQVDVDEKWYRQHYADVDQAIRAGHIVSARDHFIKSGYFENRLPRAVKVNERWYLEEYPDVAAAIQYGVFTSATQHFERDGYREGRLPSEDWSLLGVRAAPQLIDA